MPEDKQELIVSIVFYDDAMKYYLDKGLVEIARALKDLHSMYKIQHPGHYDSYEYKY